MSVQELIAIVPWDIVFKAVEIIVILLAVIFVSAMMIWGERRLLGLWQDRYGPNRVGYFGLLQVAADMIKIFFKQDWTPRFVDKPVFILAPVISMATILIAYAVVPITPDIGIATVNIGILFFLAMISLDVYAVMLAGWASNSKYSLLGGLRAAAQMVSYEVFMGLALMGVVLLAGSFNLYDIVTDQADCWNVIKQPLGFFLFFTAGVAATHRSPFDMPEAEHELTAGYHTEYSGMKFGMFFVGEYVGMTLVASLVTVLYFGGWHGPLLPPLLWFVIKVLFFLMLFILFRATWPRPRYDQLMAFGWKVMLPLTLVNLVVTGAFVVGGAN